MKLISKTGEIRLRYVSVVKGEKTRMCSTAQGNNLTDKLASVKKINNLREREENMVGAKDSAHVSKTGKVKTLLRPSKHTVSV